MVDLIVWGLAIGAALCILAGFGLGVLGDDAEKKRAKKRAARFAAELREERGARRAAEAARERAEAREALAVAARDDYRRQLALAEDALAKVTYTNAPAPAVPEDDAPRGSHHRPEPEPCRSLTSDPFAPGSPEMYCEHDDGQGHTGRHTAYDGDAEWDDHGELWLNGDQQ